MSTYGMTLTVLATGLAEAVGKDEAPEVGGFDLSAGLFGPHVSDWLRGVAKELDDRATASCANPPAADSCSAASASNPGDPLQGRPAESDSPAQKA